jgi:hypothetical protein
VHVIAASHKFQSFLSQVQKYTSIQVRLVTSTGGLIFVLMIQVDPRGRGLNIC